ncbi:class I SAM-dependent methyltransferase [Paraglaciecola sp. 25GB23A]|uniref:class I SAM-dependent methyltransferase n=1 Tax=Paraglaciecola sp. 25GB23A TaxID=3156068 RepID=UPI0032AFA9B1
MASFNKVMLRKQNSSFIAISDDIAHALDNLWALPFVDKSIEQLSAENVLQYLTSMEADFAMLKWSDALSKGGVIEIVVPNTDYYLTLWQQASWSNTDLTDAESLARQAFAGLWGTQQDGNPRNENYQPYYQDIYKSGYNAARLQLLLERAGFCDIQINEVNSELLARANKTMERGERQITTHYDQIRPDHLNRYEFACKTLGQLTPAHQIVDLACGIGYGSLLLAKETTASVTGVDIDSAAITHAQQYFSNKQTHFICEDARFLSLEEQSKDAIVSFETIEHIDFDAELLTMFYKLLKPSGQLICSTPNQDVMPFDKQKFKFHIKHYTNTELTQLLTQAGFKNIQLFAQRDPVMGKVVVGQDGSFTIAVATK